MKRAVELEGANEGWQKRLEVMESMVERMATREAREMYRKAVESEKAGNHEGAEEGYRGVVKMQPEMGVGHYRLGLVLQKQGKWESAAESMKRAVELESANKVWQKRLQVMESMVERMTSREAREMYRKASGLEKEGNYEGAEEGYRGVVRMQPEMAVGHYRLGQVLQKQGKWEEAAESMKRAVELESANEGWQKRLEVMESVVERMASREAREMYRKASELERERNLEGAEEGYRGVVRMQPEMAVGHYRLGLVLQKQGKWEEAAESMKRAVELERDIIVRSIKKQDILQIDDLGEVYEFNSELNLYGKKILLIYDSGADESLLFNIANSSSKAFIYTNEKQLEKCKRFLLTLSDKVEIFTQKADDYVANSNEESDISEISLDLIKHFENKLKTHCKEYISQEYETFSEALNLKLEDDLFKRLIIIRRIHDFIAGNNLDVIIHLAKTHESIKFYLPIAVSFQKCLRLCFCYKLKKNIESSYQFEKTKQQYVDPKNIKEKIYDLIHNSSLHLWSKSEGENNVAIFGDFNPDNFRQNGVIFKIVESITKTNNAILIQQTPSHSKKVKSYFASESISSRCVPSIEFNDVLSQFDVCENLWISALVPPEITKSFSHLSNTNQLSKISCNITQLYNSLELIFKIFFTHEMIPIITIGHSFLKTIQRNPLLSVVILQSDRTVWAQALISATKKYSLPSFLYIFYYYSKNPRYKKPVTSYLLLPDTSFLEFFNKHYGFNSDNMFLVGSHMVARMSNDRKNSDAFNYLKLEKNNSANSNQINICFATQHSLGPLSSRALKMLAEAVRELSVFITVKPHPLDKISTLNYQKILDECGFATRSHIDATSSSTEILCRTNLLVTLFSNIALEAAAQSIDVLTIKLEKIDYPIKLAEIGIAIEAENEAQIREIVYQLSRPSSDLKKYRLKREKFFMNNPQLLALKVEDNIALASTKMNFKNIQKQILKVYFDFSQTPIPHSAPVDFKEILSGVRELATITPIENSEKSIRNVESDRYKNQFNKSFIPNPEYASAIILSDSIALPRPSVDVLFEDTYPVLLQDKMLKSQTSINLLPSCLRGRTVLSACDELKGYQSCNSKPVHLILQLGIVDCSPRVFLQRDIEIIKKLVGKDYSDKLISIASNYRNLVVGDPATNVYVSVERFETALFEISNLISNISDLSKICIVNIVTPIKNQKKSNLTPLGINIGKYNDIIKKVCLTTGATLVDADTAVWTIENPSICFSNDNYHYNKEGHKIVAHEIFEKFLSKI
jgi:superkiller protein 3